MNINVNNCEAFFLDYYEGNLSEGQVAELFAFLKLHPQVREAFESFADISVNEENVSSPDFSFLKKEVVVDEHEQAEVWMVDFIENEISDIDRLFLENYFQRNPSKTEELEMLQKTILHADPNEKLDSTINLKRLVAITSENFDDFAIASIEGTINAEDLVLLNNFVAKHPEFAKQLEEYKKTILQSDASISFQHKDELKKKSVVISAENIEEMLISKLEGQLTSEEEYALDAFLVTHPEFASELVLLEQTIVRPDPSVHFEGEANLKRGVLVVSEENFEELAISASEGLLNSDELATLHGYGGSNSTRKKLIAAYANVKAQPDMSIVYADKEGLKRKDRGGIIWWSANIRFAAAAVLVLLLGVYAFIKYGSGISDQPGDVIANKINSKDKQVDSVIIPNNSPIPDPSTYASVEVPSNNNKPKNNKGRDNIVPVNATSKNTIEFTYIPARVASQSIANEGNDKVDFSDALYAVIYNPVETAQQNKYLSPGQALMRWANDKLKGDESQLESNDALVAQTREANKSDGNVDGLDLTESAVNRVGMAFNGNVGMDQRQDGTYVKLWKYSVRVGS